MWLEEGGGLFKRQTESEMEHVAYREISTECSLMNAPLYLCYNGKKRRLYEVFLITPLPLSGSFPWTQGM